MSAFRVRPLSEQTWPDFAALVEANNGVWGGCWCMAFHEEGVKRGSAMNRAEKERRVRERRKHRRAYEHGRKVSSSFLHNGALSMFERQGFERIRRIGKHHWVVAKVV